MAIQPNTPQANADRPANAPPPAPPPTPQTNAPDDAPRPAAAAPEMTDEQRAEMYKARFRNSRGAQVILDPESDASLGARGGAGATVVENTLVRDRHLVDHDMNPRDPDATHLPGNIVPAGGEITDQVPDELEPRADVSHLKRQE